MMRRMPQPLFQPVVRDGSRVVLRIAGSNLYQNRTQEDEERRRDTVATNRAYYAGTQFDADNAAWRSANGLTDPKQLTPEHKRLHSYSTQIADCVDYIVNQLSDGFGVVVEDDEETRKATMEAWQEQQDAVKAATPAFVKAPRIDKPAASQGTLDLQDIIDKAVQSSEVLNNGDDDDIGIDEILKDAGIAGDVAYETLWDPIEQTCYWEFWAAEDVEFEVPRGRWVKNVVRRQRIFTKSVDPNGLEVEEEVEERVVWDLDFLPMMSEISVVGGDVPEPRSPVRPAPVTVAADVVADTPHLECRRRVYHDDGEDPVQTDWLGLPFIPWGLIRIDKRGLAGFRGDPLITRRALDNADRYNANEQHAWLIGRYNSHGNIAVVGDQAFLKLELDPIVNKDVADILRFPGGTAVFPITLPTDPTMIEHVKGVVADAIYASFGLVRVEPDTINGLGAPSGYALEILNRKSDGTFRRARRTVKRDVITMTNQMLDVTAYRRGAVLTDDELIQLYEENPELDVPVGMLPEVPFWDIDPREVFPDRNLDVRMGSGYIVDSVQIRDDFTAKLISHKEALRRLGMSNDDIEQILDELETEGKQQFETAAAQFMAKTGQSIEEAQAEKSAEKDALDAGADPLTAAQQGAEAARSAAPTDKLPVAKAPVAVAPGTKAGSTTAAPTFRK
jgi:hypothetical protein